MLSQTTGSSHDQPIRSTANGYRCRTEPATPTRLCRARPHRTGTPPIAESEAPDRRAEPAKCLGTALPWMSSRSSRRGGPEARLQPREQSKPVGVKAGAHVLCGAHRGRSTLRRSPRQSVSNFVCCSRHIGQVRGLRPLVTTRSNVLPQSAHMSVSSRTGPAATGTLRRAWGRLDCSSFAVA
jgi:hypothetical protein